MNNNLNIKPLVKLENLKVHFKLKRTSWFSDPQVVHAVDGISLEVNRGKTLGLVGESGCGKTTAGRAILGLVKSNSGEIYFEDKALTSISADEMFPLRKRMQIIFQDPYSALNPRQTAGDIVSDPLVVHNIGSKKERQERVDELFSMVGLQKKSTSSLSSSIFGWTTTTIVYR